MNEDLNNISMQHDMEILADVSVPLDKIIELGTPINIDKKVEEIIIKLEINYENLKTSNGFQHTIKPYLEKFMQAILHPVNTWKMRKQKRRMQYLVNYRSCISSDLANTIIRQVNAELDTKYQLSMEKLDSK